MTIPANNIVFVNPSSLSAGGASLGFNGMILTDSDILPEGAPVPFPNYQAVASLFGAESIEAKMAAVYFSGFISRKQTPTKLYFVRFGSGGGDTPYFTITCTSAAAMFGQYTEQIGDYPVMHVEIHRYNGHTAPIDVTLPEFSTVLPFVEESWMSWNESTAMRVNGIDRFPADGSVYVVTDAPDNFDIEERYAEGVRMTGFPTWWKDVHLTATDGTDTVTSNPFSLCMIWFYDLRETTLTPKSGNPFSGYLGMPQSFGLYALSPDAAALEFSVDSSFTSPWVGTGMVTGDPNTTPSEFTATITGMHEPSSPYTVYNIHASITIPAIVVGGVTLPEQIFSLSQPINGQSG